MLQRVKDKVLNPRHAAGLHIKIGAAQTHYRFCLLTLEKDVVRISRQPVEISEIKELQALLPERTPVAVCVQGKGILTKKVSGDKFQPDEKATLQLVKEAWPAVTADNFYMQRHDVPGGVFLSMIRRDQLDALLLELQAAGIAVVDVKLGAAPLAYVLPYVEALPESIHIEEEAIEISEKEIREIKTAKEASGSEQVFKIGEDNLPASGLLAYSMALNLLAIKQLNPLFYCTPADELRKEWEQSRLFRVMGFGFLGLLLTILLVNFFLFSYYHNQNQELSLQYEQVAGQAKHLTALKEKQQTQQKLLATTGWLKPVKGSFYLDRLAATVPAAIRLTELDLNPVNQKESKKEKKIILTPGVLLVRGRCASSLPLNAWIQQVSKLKWVKQVQGQTYSYDSNQATGKFEFLLVLND